MPRTPDDFWDRGYVVARGLVDPGQQKFLRAAMDVALRTGTMQHAAGIVPQGAMNQYSPVAGDALLKQCLPAFEEMTDRALTPAYARWRVYERGAELLRHRDRDACEISASLPVFSVPADDAWPIHVEDLHGQEAGVALRPGDAIVYQGCRVAHWREPYAGQRQYQIFLHYVIKGGEREHHAFDGRDGLSLDG